MTSAETCGALIWSRDGWSNWPCARPVKRNGLCGTHARMEEKREERRQARREAKP